MRAASRIAVGLSDQCYLRNLDAKRDWGRAKDEVRMMWMILQVEKVENWVCATGTTTSVRDIVKMHFLNLKFPTKNGDGNIKEILRTLMLLFK
jgi:GDPmannose 4,6-dehydratase